MFPYASCIFWQYFCDKYGVQISGRSTNVLKNIAIDQESFINNLEQLKLPKTPMVTLKNQEKPTNRFLFSVFWALLNQQIIDYSF